MRRTTYKTYCKSFRELLCVTLFLAWSSLAGAVEVGDTVRVRDGGGFRTGTVVGTLGNAYRVRYDDGHMPTEELLDERSFVSDEEIERGQRAERLGQFYQAIGRAIGYAAAVAMLFLFAFWYTMRKNRGAADRMESEVVDAELIDPPGINESSEWRSSDRPDLGS